MRYKFINEEKAVGNTVRLSTRCCSSSTALPSQCQKREILQSAPAKAGDNATVESFFRTIKAELIWRMKFATRIDAERKILAYISAPAKAGDNATVESFFRTIKAELIWRMKFATRIDAERKILAYINDFYTPRRRHSALGNISPAAYEKLAA